MLPRTLLALPKMQPPPLVMLPRMPLTLPLLPLKSPELSALWRFPARKKAALGRLFLCILTVVHIYKSPQLVMPPKPVTRSHKPFFAGAAA